MYEAILSITSRCNLHCPFCLGRYGLFKNENDLPLAEWERFFQELEDNRYFYVKLTGAGEPFIRPDIVDICRSIASHRMRFRIYSNGTLITPQIAQALAQTKRCDYIRISLDSTKSSHNATRGEGAYERAIAGIKALLAEGISVRVHSTITHETIGTLESFLTELNEIGVTQFSNAFVTPSRDHKDYFRHQNFLSAQDAAASIKEHRELPSKLRRLIISSTPLTLWKRWLAWLHTPEKFPVLSREFIMIHCPRLGNSITVSTQGYYIPCFYQGDLTVGRINEISIDEAQQRIKDLTEKFRVEPDPDCRECPYLPVCRYTCKGRQNFCFKEIFPFLEKEDFKNWPQPEEVFKCWVGR